MMQAHFNFQQLYVIASPTKSPICSKVMGKDK